MVHRFVILAAAAQLAAAECMDASCAAQEEVSLLQSRGGRTSAQVASAYARAAEAIRNAQDYEDTICTKAEAGDVAPVAGMYTPEDDDAFEVQAGYKAPKAGDFCVSKETMMLVQRAHGFESHKAIEAALTKKEGGSNPWGADGVFAGKYDSPTACPDVPLECKFAVYPMRHEICTILWTTQNQWLEKLPGCGVGAEARRNIEGACFRDRNLKLTCPLKCNEIVEYGKTLNEDLQESYVCWASGCDNTALSTGVNDFMKDKIMEVAGNMPKFLQDILKVDKDTYPCDVASVETLCSEHCPTTCQMVLDAAVDAGQGSAAELCAGSCAGLHEDTATSWNDELVSSLTAVQDAIGLEATVAGPCDAASVQSICTPNCR